MRNSDQQPYGRSSPNPTLPSPAALALALAALLACAALLVFIDARQASAQDTSGRQQGSQERERSGKAGGSETGGSGNGGSGNALGVIVDIPEGWPLNDKGGGHDIVRFEKCFPFCNVERLDGGSSGGQDGGETVIEGTTSEQTNAIKQTSFIEETQINQGGTDEGDIDEGDIDEGDIDEGDGGGRPEEQTVPEETTLMEPTMESTMEPTVSDPDETTAPPGDTAGCPTGPSGPISEVTLREVLDADTLEVEGSDGNAYTIRLIGAEAPDLAGGGAEGGEDKPGAEEAAEFTREALGGRGQKLDLEYDGRKTDENGQTFAYVWMEADGANPKPATTELLDVDETPGPVLFNRQLVESGYARAATAEPNTDYAGCLKQAEEAARADGAGLWAEQASSPGSPGTGSASGVGAVAGAPGATNSQTSDAAVGAVSIELASQRVPVSKAAGKAKANAKANAKAGAGDSAIPPITGHAKPPEPTQARAAHPGFAVALAASILAASLLAAITLRRGGPLDAAQTGAPAGAGPTEGGGN